MGNRTKEKTDRADTSIAHIAKKSFFPESYQWISYRRDLPIEPIPRLYCKSAQKCSRCKQSIYHHLILTDRNTQGYGYAVEYVLNDKSEKNVYCPLGNCRCCKKDFPFSLQTGDNMALGIHEVYCREYYREAGVFMAQVLLFSDCYHCRTCRHDHCRLAENRALILVFFIFDDFFAVLRCSFQLLVYSVYQSAIRRLHSSSTIKCFGISFSRVFRETFIERESIYLRHFTGTHWNIRHVYVDFEILTYTNYDWAYAMEDVVPCTAISVRDNGKFEHRCHVCNFISK